MAKKLISLILILIFCLPAGFSADTSKNLFPEYKPYTREEFPVWSQNLRRAETLFFGSLALTLPVSIGSYNLASQVFPIVVPTEASTQLLQQVGIACCVSLLIVVVDFIIGEVRDKN